MVYRLKKIIFPVLVLFASGIKLHAADSLFVQLYQADSLFFANNLLLIAEEFNIEKTKALQIASKAFPNPIFTVDLNIYDPENNRAFHVGASGQKQFMLEQLIPIGGKRKTQIDIAKKNTELAVLEYEDFIRNLQFEIHSSFFTLNREYRTIKLFDEQMALLDTLINLYEIQVSKNNLPLKDLVRLRSVYLKFSNERSDLLANFIAETKQMQILLGTTAYVIPVYNENSFASFTLPVAIDSLIQRAYSSRPDYEIADGEMQLAMLQVKYEKKQVIPDIKLNFAYDQRGGAFLNQFNGGFSIPLPLWNFNTGQVKLAKANLDVSKLYIDIKKQEILSEVNEAFSGLQLAIDEYNKMKSLYTDDFDQVYDGMKANFSKRNITIIDFTDFIEAYNETVTDVEITKARLAIAASKINCVTASKIY